MKRARNITDRGLRYRAVKAMGQASPKMPKLCNMCGSKRNVGVDHVDGREENTRPENLMYACKSCNTTKGLHFHRIGFGRLTKQFNPGRKSAGAQNMDQWVLAVLSIKGQSDAMKVDDAVRLIHDTPKERRAKFAREIYAKRRKVYGPTGRSDSRGEVPF